MIHSSDETDVGVVSLDDRRKIRDLEAKNADLERKLQQAHARVQPALERETGEKCYHSGGFLVADEVERITCKQCGEVVNPYEALRKIAHRETNFCYTLNSLRSEAATLTKDIERLKGQKSRLKTAVRKAGDPQFTTIEAFAKHYELTGIGFQWIYGGLEAIARTRPRKASEGLDWKPEDLRAVGETVPQAIDHLVILLDAQKKNVTGKP